MRCEVCGGPCRLEEYRKRARDAIAYGTLRDGNRESTNYLRLQAKYNAHEVDAGAANAADYPYEPDPALLAPEPRLLSPLSTGGWGGTPPQRRRDPFEWPERPGLLHRSYMARMAICFVAGMVLDAVATVLIAYHANPLVVVAFPLVVGLSGMLAAAYVLDRWVL